MPDVSGYLRPSFRTQNNVYVRLKIFFYSLFILFSRVKNSPFWAKFFNDYRRLLLVAVVNPISASPQNDAVGSGVGGSLLSVWEYGVTGTVWSHACRIGLFGLPSSCLQYSLCPLIRAIIGVFSVEWNNNELSFKCNCVFLSLTFFVSVYLAFTCATSLAFPALSLSLSLSINTVRRTGLSSISYTNVCALSVASYIYQTHSVWYRMTSPRYASFSLAAQILKCTRPTLNFVSHTTLPPKTQSRSDR